ncbi:MAG TPA: ribbon-helix-helix protein, CopG family [Candidatus Acidoferrum sp.]|nr:ribbon-helix-helix protein, CopG family [Candidatus Acidoferrum sp.]
MATALIHLDPKQKRRLTMRAKKRGKSFSQEVRDAVDLYLEIPIETEAEMKTLARLASESADRSIARLDDTIAYLDKALKALRKSR